ncbi:MAG: hypothetical protein CR982_05070 [Candidatus Cloacimonadota bacterium]|nr:MAG: hypothetical protein CR982_05070 [Candidatus Cloacimonadota bacterium]PIE80539.1 MAG: hypothetical protein CSA15_01900 [Candidatus Delongbacteria bacterium]
MKFLLLSFLAIVLISCSNSSTDSSNSVVRKIDLYKNRNNIFDAVLKGDQIYLGTQYGFIKTDLTGKILDSYTKEDGLVSDSIYSITVDNKGRFWLGTHNGISIVKGDKIENIQSENRLYSNHVNDITMDNNGDFWIGTDNGINFFDTKKWKLYKFADGLPGNYINCVKFDKGILYFGTDSGVFIKNGDDWKSYTVNDGLIDDNILSIEVKNGKIYIGTSAGLSVIDGDNIINYDSSNGLVSSGISNIVVDGDRLILATYLGGVIFENGESEIFNTGNGFLNNLTNGVFLHNNNIFFSTKKGLVKLDSDKNIENYIYGPTDKIVDFDPKTGLLVTKYEVLKIENDVWSLVSSVSEVGFSSISDLAYYNDKIFISSEFSGFYTIDNSGETVLYDKDNSPLESNKIFRFNEIGGELFISTSKGAYIFSEGDSWESFTKDDGLITKKVYDVESENGNLWFASNKGVSIKSGDEWSYLDESNGLVNKAILDLLYDGTNMWLKSDNENFVTKYTDGNLETIYIDENNSSLWIFDMAKAGSSTLLLASDGLYRYNGTDFDMIYEKEGMDMLFVPEIEDCIYISCGDDLECYKLDN